MSIFLTCFELNILTEFEFVQKYGIFFFYKGNADAFYTDFWNTIKLAKYSDNSS